MVIPLRCAALMLLLCCAGTVLGQEICDNGIDDDGDGLIDLNDSTDCSCGRSVVMDASVASVIPNPSFELYDQLPTGPSQLDNSVAWSQFTAGTPDYFHEQSFGMPNVPTPLPDGDGYVGVIVMDVAPGWGSTGPPYLEYLGAQLDEPLQAGVAYTLRTYITGGGRLANQGSAYRPPWFGPVDITVFGYPALGPYQFPFEYYGCPGADLIDWIELGHVSYQADPTWSVITISFTPVVNIAGLMIGGPCDPPADVILSPDSAAPFFIFDKLLLNRSEQFAGVIVPTGSWCANDLLLTAQAPATPTGYQWYLEGVALVGNTGSTIAIGDLDLQPGLYSCVASYADGTCLTMDHVLLPMALPPAVITASRRTGCEDLEVTVTCHSAVQNITWTFGDGGVVHTEPAEYTFREPGTYDLRVQFTTAAGCTFDTLLVDHFTVYPTPEIDLLVQPLGPYLGGEAIDLQDVGVNTERWIWVLGELPPHMVLNRSWVNITAPLAAGTYPIVVYARTPYGCIDTAYTELVVLDCSGGGIFIPTAFSPDGSGKNDLLCVRGACLSTMTFRVFDRWGTKVFESNDPEHCWDGSHNGRPLDPAVFVYHFQALLPDKSIVERRGNITLVR